MDWDDPLWVQAWGTVALFGAAVVAGVAAFAVLIVELRRDVRHRREVRSEQASAVAAWVGWVEDLPSPILRTTMPGHGCIVFNSSDLPVYAATLHFSTFSDDGKSTYLGASETLDFIEPGRTVRDVPPPVMTMWEESRGTVRSRLQVAMTFRDAAGQYWRRDADGLLERHKPST